MSKKLYRPKRKKSKEKLSFMDKLEMGSIVIAAAALIGWSGWSAMDALIPDPPVPTYSLYMDGITAFLMTTQGVEPDDQETDVETEGEDDTDATELNIREAPDKNSKALAMYMPGREITVTEDEQTHEGWLKVNKDGVEGYVSSEFVKTE